MPNRVKVTRHGSVLVVKVVGFYTERVALQARDKANAEIAKAGASKVLLDLRASTCLVDDAEWSAVAKKLAADPTRAPMAVLVTQAQLEVCLRRCLPLSQVGRGRLPFASVERAASWAGVPLSALASTRAFSPVYAAPR